jgi:hypothetical protein
MFGAGLNFVTNLEFGSLDTTLKARIGQTTCEATSWMSDSTLFCKAAIGRGMTMNSAVTVGLSESTITQAVSYSSAQISMATFSIQINLIVNGSTTVSQVIARNGPVNVDPAYVLQVK